MYQKHLLIIFNEEQKKRSNNRNNEVINKLIQANKLKAGRTKQKVYKAIQELKHKQEKITTISVMRLARVSKGSARKYIQQAKEEGII